MFREFAVIGDKIDTVAMDIKLPSAAGERDFWQEHAAFLKEAGNKDIYVKCIITLGTRLADLKKAVTLVRKADPGIIFVLQPNYAEIGDRLVKKMIKYQKYAAKELSSVRIMPQMHKFLEVR